MGSTSSTVIQEPVLPCALISLRSWKGVNMETLIAVPVTEEIFGYSPDHPLFQLLHSARNEPAVRHWYAGSNAPEVEDRTTTLQPEMTPPDLYAEVFPPTTATGVDTPAVVPSHRWMMLTIKDIQGFRGENGFMSAAEVTQLAESVGSGAAAAGFIECSHGALATTLRYWMVKTFSTEGRSLVLFQAAAFMEARRMQFARIVSFPRPAVVEFCVRSGDISSLRMLELTFRRLLPTTCAVDMSPGVQMQPQGGEGKKILQIRLSGDILVDILRQLEVAVLSCPAGGSPIPDPTHFALQTHLTGVRVLTLAVEHRQVTHIPTPFATFVDVAKEAWNSENAIVVQVQPNQRQTKVNKMALPRDKKRMDHHVSNGGMVMEGGGILNHPIPGHILQGNPWMRQDAPPPPPPGHPPPPVVLKPNGAPRAAGSSGALPTPHLHPQQFTVSSSDPSSSIPSYQQSTATNAMGRGADASGSEVGRPTLAPPPPPPFSAAHPGGQRVLVIPQTSYRLPENTQVQFFHVESASWVPMLYVDQGARLQLGNMQHQSGSVFLETVDSLTLSDGLGTMLSIQPAATTPWSATTTPETVKLVVASGSYAIQMNGDQQVAVVQLVAP